MEDTANFEDFDTKLIDVDLDAVKNVPWDTYRALIVNSEATETSVLLSLVSGTITTLEKRVPLSMYQSCEVGSSVYVNLIECSPVCHPLFC